ncbi:MAG: cation-transporting P-type ATPase [Candidatus Micrarchaeota archaeon]|nr:cation-transporting P-type ATPase [Candidatus Micrarchaeota archaeon]
MFDVQQIKNSAHYSPNKVLFKLLNSQEDGLTYQEVEKRQEYKNKLFETKSPTALELFLRQFNRMTFILFVAAAIAFLIGHYVDAIGITLAALLAMFFGFIQEYKAEEKLKFLYSLTKPKAKVLREKKVQIVDSEEIVIGDIILVSGGELIPADCKILEGDNLLADQAVLTGESLAVQKSSIEIIEKEKDIAERSNILYAGSYLLKGDAKAIVIATGKYSEFGKISHALSTIKQEPSQLSHDLEKLGNLLVKISLFFVVLIFLLGLVRKMELTDLLITSILLFVAAVPEGLPTVLAITLAYGVSRLAKENAIVRKLSALSTVAKVSVICADKTGTLTLNRLKLVKAFVSFKDFEDLDSQTTKADKSLFFLVEKALLSTNIFLEHKKHAAKEEVKEVNVAASAFGDPLEVAIADFYLKAGGEKTIFKKHFAVAEFPFDFKRRYSCFVRKSGNKLIAYLKGAPEEILANCSYYLDENFKIKKLDKTTLLKLEEKIKSYSLNAIRTIAVAYSVQKAKKSYSAEECAKNLIFVGFLGFFDPPVEGIQQTVENAKKANIVVIMITGDSPDTALAVAQQIGIIDISKPAKAVLGKELEHLSDNLIVSTLLNSRVCARATPEHKLKIVNAFQKHGYIVALTGDGVNDAPALKKADVSFAIGKGGTDVAKSVSDIILVDNNLRTILRAVEYGRATFENIRAFVSFQLTTNISALFLMFFSQLLNFGALFKPLQILWINVIMDGPPALALGLEKPKEDILFRPPTSKKEPIIERKTLIGMILHSLFFVISCLFVFWLYSSTFDSSKALSAVFNLFVLFQLANALTVHTPNPFLKDLFSNKYLLFALMGVLILHLSIFEIDFLREFFGVQKLLLFDWFIAILFLLLFFLYSDLIKIIKNSLLS